MGVEDYLSLMFIALASLGAVFITPFFVESAILISVLIIIFYKKFSNKVLAPLGLDDKALTLLILSSTIMGVNFIFKEGIFLPIVGGLYIIISLYGLINHFKFLYRLDKEG